MMKKHFYVTLITNKNCNFNCTYCYEKDKFENLDLNEEKISKIINFLKEKFKNYELTFTFIGGEPTLSNKLNLLVQEIEKNFKNSNYILITNGSSLKNILKIFPDLEKMKDRVHIQISYDGKAIHDKDRIIKKGNKIIQTSDFVLKTLDELIKITNNISLKSTLNIKYLPLVPEVIKEFRELSLKYNKIFLYAVSEVKTLIHYLSEQEIKELVKENFPNILKEEKINLEIFNRPLTQWLNKLNFKTPGAFCTASIDSITISPNLDILYCHRCEYYDKNSELIYGNIKNFDNFLKNEKIFLNNKDNYYSNCKNCEAIYCQKCPAEYAEINNIKQIDKIYNSWNDNICVYYKEISKYLYLFWKQFLKKR